MCERIICMYACLWMGTHVCECAGPVISIRYLPQLFSTFLYEKSVSHWTWSHQLVQTDCPARPRDCPVSPDSALILPVSTTTVLTWFLGTELRYWSWYGKHFADWTISTLQDLNILPECFTSISWMKTQELDNSETKSMYHSYRRIKFGFSTHL